MSTQFVVKRAEDVSHATMIKASLCGWTARRAGGYITITHSAGKVTNVLSIETLDGLLIATTSGGDYYSLALA